MNFKRRELYESIVIDGNDRALKQYFFKILKIALSKHSELLTFILGNYSCVMNLFERKELFKTIESLICEKPLFLINKASLLIKTDLEISKSLQSNNTSNLFSLKTQL